MSDSPDVRLVDGRRELSLGRASRHVPAVLGIRLSDAGLAANADVDMTDGPDGVLTAYVSSLAENWRGWSGLRSWESLEGELRLDAENLGRGQVQLDVRLRGRAHRDGRAWVAQVAFLVDAGEQLTDFALGLENVLG